MRAFRISRHADKLQAHVHVRLLQQHFSEEDGLLFAGVVDPRLYEIGFSVVEPDLHDVFTDEGGIGVCHRSLAKKNGPETQGPSACRGGGRGRQGKFSCGLVLGVEVGPQVSTQNARTSVLIFGRAFDLQNTVRRDASSFAPVSDYLRRDTYTVSEAGEPAGQFDCSFQSCHFR